MWREKEQGEKSFECFFLPLFFRSLFLVVPPLNSLNSLSLSLSNLLRRLELLAHALVDLLGRGRGARLVGGALLGEFFCFEGGEEEGAGEQKEKECEREGRKREWWPAAGGQSFASSTAAVSFRRAKKKKKDASETRSPPSKNRFSRRASRPRALSGTLRTRRCDENGERSTGRGARGEGRCCSARQRRRRRRREKNDGRSFPPSAGLPSSSSSSSSCLFLLPCPP